MTSMAPVKMGDRVRMAGVMQNDPDPIPPGSEGTVDWVGQWDHPYTRQIGVAWDSGRRLMLLEGDPYEVIR